MKPKTRNALETLFAILAAAVIIVMISTDPIVAEWLADWLLENMQ